MPSTNSTPCMPNNQPLLTVLYAFQGFYGGTSITLYVINIIALQQQRNPLDTTFCKLYITTAIVCITYFTDHYLIQRFLDLGYWCEDILQLFSTPTYLLNPYKTIASYCPIAVLILHFAISLNRLTMVIEPMQAAKKWSDNIAPIITIILLVPLIFMWFMIPCKSYIKQEEGGGLTIEYIKVFALSASAHSSIAAVLFGSATFICTVFIFMKLFYINNKRLDKSEKAMLYFEILLMITTMMYAVTQALLYASKYIFRSEVMQSTVSMFRHYIIDIFILPSAWTLPFLSRSVRRYYTMLIFRTSSNGLNQKTTTMMRRSKQRTSPYSIGNNSRS